MVRLLRLHRALCPFVLALFALACAPAASAQTYPAETQAPAHISFIDGAATLERDGTLDESPENMPLLAGDRVRTQSGRVEILFADGSTLHIDQNSAIDLQSDDLVRLLAGRIRLSIAGPARAVSYRVDAPEGWAHISEPGDYRITLSSSAGGNELELDVIRGRAELANEGGQTPLRAGERAFVRTGAAPSYAYVANSSALDAFDRWSEARRDARLAQSTEYLPPEVQPYASTFNEYGSWGYQPAYGPVWYPRVAVGWRPYYYGRWASLPGYGWTWIARDPWGWPTGHYGRWGLSVSGAWFWIPGRTWAPAWVSWAYAPGFVSWCPLGFNNQPVFAFNFININAHRFDLFRTWTFLPVRSFGIGFIPRHVVTGARIDFHTLSSFVPRSRAPEIVGRAVPRASVPISVAGTGRAVPRTTSPLYTNLPAGQARIRTDGARIRVPNGSPAPSAQQPRAAVRAVPSQPAVRSDRAEGGVPGAVTPGASTGSASQTAVRRYQAAPSSSRPERATERTDVASPIRGMGVPVHRGPAIVPQQQVPSPAVRPSPSNDPRMRAIPRTESPAPSVGVPIGPIRVPSGSYERQAPAQPSPAARPAGGGASSSAGPPQGARPRGAGHATGGRGGRR